MKRVFRYSFWWVLAVVLGVAFYCSWRQLSDLTNGEVAEQVHDEGEAIRRHVDRRAEELEGRLNGVDLRLSRSEASLKSVDARLERIEGKLDRILRIAERSLPDDLSPAGR